MTTKRIDKANTASEAKGIDREKIMCIGRGTFNVLKEKRLIDRGFTPWNRDKHISIINGELTLPMERTQDLEEDPSFKQIIPYITLVRNREFFWYRRKSGASNSSEGDDRLNGSISIGIGGHWKGGETFLECVSREYKEEFGSFPLADVVYGEAARHALIYADKSISFLFSSIFPVGLIWDESNAVGKVHLGVLLQIELSSAILPSSGSDLEHYECGWSSLENLRRTKGEDFEAWTRIVVERGLVR